MDSNILFSRNIKTLSFFVLSFVLVGIIGLAFEYRSNLDSESTEALGRAIIVPEGSDIEIPPPVKSSNSLVKTQCKLTCEGNCFLFPVGKAREVVSRYVPTVEKIVNSEVEVAPEAHVGIYDMFRYASQEKGLKLYVVKGYVPFDEEDDDRKGKSEHQIGTAVDIAFIGATDTQIYPEPSVYTERHTTMYEFLEQEAYKYGFVLSYPPGSESKTGFKAEPWHLRFIGKTLAREYFESDATYLEEFLERRCSGYNSVDYRSASSYQRNAVCEKALWGGPGAYCDGVDLVYCANNSSSPDRLYKKCEEGCFRNAPTSSDVCFGDTIPNDLSKVCRDYDIENGLIEGTDICCEGFKGSFKDSSECNFKDASYEENLCSRKYIPDHIWDSNKYERGSYCVDNKRVECDAYRRVVSIEECSGVCSNRGVGIPAICIDQSVINDSN